MQMYCVTHLPIETLRDSAVIPVFVGKGLPPAGFLTDSSGDNIHVKNDTFCEMTAQYWVWKNEFNHLKDDDLVGFCHYRRFLVAPDSLSDDGSIDASFYDKEELEKLVSYYHQTGADVILAPRLNLEKDHFHGKFSFIMAQIMMRRPRIFWKCTTYAHYATYQNASDILKAADLLDDRFRNRFLYHIRHSKCLYPCNMYIGSVKTLSAYFAIVFPWLFRCEKTLDVDMNDTVRRRVFGYLAEFFASYYFSTVVTFREGRLAMVRS